MNPRVLLVDDEPDFVDLMSFNLRRSGYRVRCASNGVEALVIVRRQALDAVILDLMMPELDGYSVCETLRKTAQCHPLPILMVTAATSQLSRLNALAVGADDVLSKPFSASELLSKLSRLLELAAGRNVRQWA